MVKFDVINRNNLDAPYINSLFNAFVNRLKANYSSKDLIDSIKHKQSVMIVATDENGDYLGFFVLSEKETYEGLELFIWAAQAARTLKDSEIDEIMGCIKKIAAHMGVPRISFSTPRAGWGRRAKKFGFQQQTVTYGIEL